MKEAYQNPEMEVCEFSAGDVITTSDKVTRPEDWWVPRVNEGAPDYNAWG